MNTIPVISVNQCPDFPSLWKHGQEIQTDWFGARSAQAPRFLCALDDTHFHFLAGDQNPPTSHPEAQVKGFQPELWKYDVAEFFLAAPDRSSYLEFNLAPNGAWWSSFFGKPRVALDKPPLAGVDAVGELTADSWQARASIPREELGLMEGSLLNITFILGSPAQRFFTAAPLSAPEPDFHRPTHFLPISLST